MLPRKCLTSCEVPYLCAIACPLNERLDEFAPKPTRTDDAPAQVDEPLDIVIGGEKESPPNAASQNKQTEA